MQNQIKKHIFLRNDILWNWCQPWPREAQRPAKQAVPNMQKRATRILRFIISLSPFIPNLADKIHTLWGLLKKDTPFLWEEHHKECFEKLKTVISQDSTLTYINTIEIPVLQTDASLKGLGAALIQNKKPITYASKSLTDTEKWYACIEKEHVFGVQRFHIYLYGHQFKVLTDHKPLVMILQKPLTSAPPRLQWIIIKLQGYQMQIKDIPGEEMTLADTLSDLLSTENTDTINQDRVDLVRFRSERLKEIRKKTKADPVFDQLQGIITAGWPNSIKFLPPVLRSYWPYWDLSSMVSSWRDQELLFLKPNKKLSWTSYITAIKVLKKHVFKPEMLYTGSELMQISTTWSRIVPGKPSGMTKGNFTWSRIVPGKPSGMTKGNFTATWHPPQSMGSCLYRFV